MVKLNDQKMTRVGKGAEVWTTPSSTQEDVTHYTMFFPLDNKIQCSCSGFRFRETCWHSKTLAKHKKL